MVDPVVSQPTPQGPRAGSATAAATPPMRTFNPMQHLLIHLPCEPKIGGPVQYR